MKKMMNVVLVIEMKTYSIEDAFKEEALSLTESDGDMELFLKATDTGETTLVGMCKLENAKEKFKIFKERFKEYTPEFKFHSFGMNVLSEGEDIKGKNVIDMTRMGIEIFESWVKALRLFTCESTNTDDLYLESLKHGRMKLGKCNNEVFNIMFNRINKIFFEGKLRVLKEDSPKQWMNVDIVLENTDRMNQSLWEHTLNSIKNPDGEILLIAGGTVLGRGNIEAVKREFDSLKKAGNAKQVRALFRVHDRSVYESCDEQASKRRIILPNKYPGEYLDMDIVDAVTNNNKLGKDIIIEHLTNTFVDNTNGDIEVSLDWSNGATTYLGRCNLEKLESQFEVINDRFYDNELRLDY